MKLAAMITGLLTAVAAGAALADGGERFVKVATTILGHPAHPMFIVFPIALFLTAALFDLVYYAKRNEFWRSAATWVLLCGFLGGAVAAALGFLDFFTALPKSGDVHHAAIRHWHWAVPAMSLVAIDLLLRAWKKNSKAIIALTTVLTLAAALCVSVAGYWGGDMVFNDKVGVMKVDE